MAILFESWSFSLMLPGRERSQISFIRPNSWNFPSVSLEVAYGGDFLPDLFRSPVSKRCVGDVEDLLCPLRWRKRKLLQQLLQRIVFDVVWLSNHGLSIGKPRVKRPRRGLLWWSP